MGRILEMEVYVGIYFFTAIFACLYLNVPESNRKALRIPIYLMIMVLIGFVVFRDGIGTDYETYFGLYQGSPGLLEFLENPFYRDVEFGFGLLNAVAKTFNLGFPFVSFFCISVTLWNYNRAAKNFGLDFIIVFLTYLGLYFISHNFNVIRHGLATSFVWHAFSYVILKKGLKKSLFLLILSSLFHSVSIIFIPFLWIIDKTISYKVMFTSLLFAVLIVVLQLNIVTVILDSLFFWSSKYQFYKLVYYQNVGGETNYGLASGVVLNLILLIVLMYMKMRENNNHSTYQTNHILINGLYFALLALLLLSTNGVFAERIGGIFYVSLIFLIPLIFQIYFDFKTTRSVFSIIFVIYIGLYFFKTVTVKEKTGEYQYLPYKSVMY